MDKNSFKFQMRVVGWERKEVAGLIARYFGTKAAYEGMPSLAYMIKESTGREWLVDKVGTVITQGVAEDGTVFAMLRTLDENGLTPQGQVAITIGTEGHNGVTLRNLVNILAAKERLIVKVMDRSDEVFIPRAIVEAINAVRLSTVDDFLTAAKTAGYIKWSGIEITKENITFRWFAATLNPEAIQAYIQFVFAVNKMALTQKHSTPREVETANEKYSFRTWLLRLGFIGEE